MIGRKFAVRFGAAAGMLWIALANANADTKPPAEAFAVLPAEPPQISPDGTRFALIRDINGRPAVAVYKIDAPQDPPQIITSDDWIIAGMRWVKNDALIVYDTKNMKLGVYDRYKSDLLRSLGDAATALLNEHKLVHLTAYARIVDIDLDSPDTVYAIYQNSVYSMNIRTGAKATPFLKHYQGPTTTGGLSRKEPINLGGEIAIKWFMDGHGKVLARVDSFRDRASFDKPLWHRTLKVLDGDTWRTLGTYDATVDVDDGVAGVSEDGRAIIRLAPHPEATASVDRIEIASGAETTVIQDPRYDVSDTLADDWTGKVIGYVVDEDMPVYRYFDPKREALQKGLEAAFPGLSVHAVSTDLAGDRAVVEVVGPKTPPSYYLYDRTTHHVTAVAASYPDLTDSALGDAKPYGYAARDGLHIPAYLTLPPGRDPHNLPLVVMPHGGPDGRDDMTFDFLSQFLASRGYAVLRPQFRGSAGYGRPFTRAGLHQWGLKMQDDITDGVKKTIADGIADPKRVCIFGASYGGYAALAGATVTPEVYACVISYAGIASLPNLLGYDEREFGVDISHGSWTTTRMGDLFTDSAQLDATSPALHADHVRAPILLLHSELDVTVPIAQSELMEAALKQAGKKVEFVHVPGDDHYLRLEQTRLAVLHEVEKFLAANIGTEASATAAK
ncbi:MAG TPA: alpha/beta fold hydrolase [Rhizomicrobium sp.]|jgi:dipeptidyl aminopeptidase/acylaminoacyl peptidase|nr:alpha/beta fold hydrolase [Rhizomicrobium sp.]